MVDAVPVSRRERVRAAAFFEIKQTARQLLIRNGIPGISVRAIAREMGITASALYRYYPSLDQLIAGLCADLFDELRLHLQSARDAERPDDLDAQLTSVGRAFRSWSVAHPAEFALIFASARPDLTTEDGDPPGGPSCAATRFATMLEHMFRDIWLASPFPVEPADAIDPALLRQLERYGEARSLDMPPGAIKILLSSWIRLYGTVALEVFGHLRFALSDAEAMFEAEMASAGRPAGITHDRPGQVTSEAGGTA